MKVRAVVATQDRPRGPHAPAMGTPRRTRHRADCAVSSLPENTTARAPWASAAQMPHSRRRGRCSLERPRLLHRGSAPMPLRRAAAAYPCRISPECPAVATYRRHASRGGQVAAIFRRNASPGCRPWQDFAPMRSRAAGRSIIPPRCLFRALVDGRTLAKCVPRRPTVARYRRGAFPGGDPWQLFHFMRSRRGPGREKRQFVARYRRHASETSRLWQDIRAVHPKSDASSRLRIHRAKILPGRGPFRCAGLSDHARRADLAVVRHLNEKRSGKAK